MVPVLCISMSQELKIDFLTENLKNLLVKNNWTDFNNILWSSSKIVQATWIRQKTWPPRGLFSLFIYIESFKNLLVRNHWPDFIITWQECFFYNPLPRFFKPSWFVKKETGPPGGGAYFPYIPIMKILKIFVINHWTNLNITWQKKNSLATFCQDCSSRYDLSKTWLLGCGGWGGVGVGGGGSVHIFPIYLYRKL